MSANIRRALRPCTSYIEIHGSQALGYRDRNVCRRHPVRRAHYLPPQSHDRYCTRAIQSDTDCLRREEKRRTITVKISHAQFSDRFSREAKAVAVLNHPNICTLYDVGPNYLVMELVEGATLAERIRQGPIPLPEALEIAG